MPVRIAVILAAGMGTRLEQQGENQPKGFLQLGEKPIVEESLERLSRAGIEHVIIVTGHRAAFYEQLAMAQEGFVELVHNPRYADSGSMYSLYCARELLQEDFLLLESDLIYEQRALEALLNDPRRALILLSGRTDSGDEVYVEANGPQVVGMSKNRHELGNGIAGELVGISKISRSLFVRMCTLAAPVFTTTLHMDYETDALVAAARGHPLHYHRIPDLLWAEIDDARQLSRARKSVYPAILLSESRRY